MRISQKVISAYCVVGRMGGIKTNKGGLFNGMLQISLNKRSLAHKLFKDKIVKCIVTITE